MKNTLQGISSRLTEAEGQRSELEVRWGKRKYTQTHKTDQK